MKLELFKKKEEVAELVDESAGQGDLGQWINSSQAARIIGVSQARIRHFVDDGRLVSHAPEDGRRDHMFKRADVEAFAKKKRKITGRPEGSTNEGVEENEDGGVGV